jgi:hypothetical protein
MPQETEQRRLSAVKSMQNTIDSIIYAMYTQENVEYCWGSCFGSYSVYKTVEPKTPATCFGGNAKTDERYPSGTKLVVLGLWASL